MLARHIVEQGERGTLAERLPGAGDNEAEIQRVALREQRIEKLPGAFRFAGIALEQACRREERRRLPFLRVLDEKTEERAAKRLAAGVVLCRGIALRMHEALRRKICLRQ